jgi:hypothetical protein
MSKLKKTACQRHYFPIERAHKSIYTLQVSIHTYNEWNQRSKDASCTDKKFHNYSNHDDCNYSNVEGGALMKCQWGHSHIMDRPATKQARLSFTAGVIAHVISRAGHLLLIEIISCVLYAPNASRGANLFSGPLWGSYYRKYSYTSNTYSTQLMIK